MRLTNHRRRFYHKQESTGTGAALMAWHRAEPSVETIDPRAPDGPPAKALFPRALINKVHKTNPVAFENLRYAKEVLEAPHRIFEGTREHQRGGWCFVGRPTEWYLREGVIVPFPKDKVFAVYLNPRMLVYAWRAEPADPEDRSSPLGFKTRYRRQVWPSTSSPTT